MISADKVQPSSTKDDLDGFLNVYLNKLVHHAFFRLGNMQDAEDVVHDVIIKAYIEKERKNILNLPAYMFRIVSNACIDRQRKNANNKVKSIDYSVEALQVTIPDHSEKMMQDSEFLRINNLLMQIPEDQSEIIRLKLVDELSFVDIAEILELPATTVKSRFKYGIEKLQNFYVNVKKV